MQYKRVFLIVLDSFGIGEMPDAAEYGDVGSNTLASVAASSSFHCPNMTRLGLFRIDGTRQLNGSDAAPIGIYGRLEEASKGKDTTTGHWEICSLISQRPFPTYPNGFPTDVINAFSHAVGKRVLCNRPYSGTKVIADYGATHMQTGDLIVYTSADSVFQIAAHEDIVPLHELYDICQTARSILQGEHGVARVIARPFTGSAPNFQRTANRRDFSLPPHGKTLLNVLQDHGYDTIGIGKINDIFASSGISRAIITHGNEEGMEQTTRMLAEDFTGLCFVNLVDFDMLYGHRNDVEGYAKALTAFDRWVGPFMEMMHQDDLLIITADHGCDPATPSTDHSREYTPALLYAHEIQPYNLGTRSSFSDIGKTIADLFHVDSNQLAGQSFVGVLER